MLLVFFLVPTQLARYKEMVYYCYVLTQVALYSEMLCSYPVAL